MTCPYLAINNTDISLSITGTFSYYNTTYLGRPVYKSDTWPFYLYFHQVNECTTMWSVGEVVGESTGIAYVVSDDDMYNPEQISGEWTLLVDGEWVSNNNMTVFCL